MPGELKENKQKKMRNPENKQTKKKTMMAFDVWKSRRDCAGVCVCIPLGRCFSGVWKGLSELRKLSKNRE